MKNKKSIIGIVSVILLVAAAVTAIIVFRNQISDFISSVVNKLSWHSEPDYTEEEEDDFADI